MTNPLDNLMKNTLIGIYYNDPITIQAIDKLDFTQVNYKFKQELFERIDEDTFSRIDSFLRGEDYAKYKNAIDGASIAVTRELGEMMNFIFQENNGYNS